MASRALTKEVKGLVSKARTGTRKRLEAAYASDRVMGSVGGSGGAIGVALIDKDEAPGENKVIEVFGVDVPVNMALGAAVAAGGAYVGKGGLAAGAVGAGMTAFNIGLYNIVRKKLGESSEG